MDKLAPGLELQLRESWERARGGAGSLFVFHEGERGPSQALKAFSFALASQDFFIELDKESACSLPYSPFCQALRARLDKDSLEGIFQSLNICPRHRPLWASLLGEGPCPLIEPINITEFYQEKIFFERDLKALLGKALEKGPLLIYCSYAQALPVESIEFLKGLDADKLPAFLLLLCFSRQPGEDKAALAAFYQEEKVQGRIIYLENGPLPRIALDSESISQASVAERIERYELLLHFMHYRSLSRDALELWSENNRKPGSLSQEQESKLLEALARSYQGMGDSDSAFYFCQILWSDILQNGRHEGRARIQSLLASLFKDKSDIENALKNAIAAFRNLREGDSEEDQAETEFNLFLIDPRDGRFPDIFTTLEKRLLERFSSLSWINHESFIQTRVYCIVNLMEKEGPERALKRAQLGLELAQRAANISQMAIAWHATGIIEQRRENFAQAEQAYLRAQELRSPITRDIDLSKMDNGLGYFYFLSGRYQRAFECHQRALRRLYRGGLYEEFLGTLFNTARVYLFNGQPKEGLYCLESLRRIMERLGLVEIPFHSSRNIYCLMGLCCLKLGHILQALELERRVLQMPDPDYSKSSDDYQLWFSCLLYAARESPESANAFYEKAIAFMSSRLSESRHILERILIDFADFQMRHADTLAEREILLQAAALYAGKDLHQRDRARIEARLAGDESEPGMPLPRIGFDPEIYLQFVKSDEGLHTLQRRVDELNFLQALQESLGSATSGAEILSRVLSIFSQHFLCEELALFKAEYGEDHQGRRLCALKLIQAKESTEGAVNEAFILERYRELGSAPCRWRNSLGLRASYLPLSYLGELQYIIWIASSSEISAEEEGILESAAWQLESSLELHQLQEKLVAAATTDALTGLPNRAEFLRRLDYQMRISARQWPSGGAEFCLLFMDLDHFKRYNDDFGHHCGDLTLQLFAQLMKRVLRTTDQYCRYGGDEFVAFLPATGVEGACRGAQRILDELSAARGFVAELSDLLGCDINFPQDLLLSCSIGIAAFEPGKGTAMEEFIGRADAAAYEAKKAGRAAYRVC